jgi:hypothetical protein
VARSAALHDGELEPWETETAAALWKSVLDRLAVADPRHQKGI